jgi:DNA invertase Pin-like site-specific DNA recombinase
MGSRRASADDFHSERDQIAALREAIARVGGELEVLPSELDVSGGLPLEQRSSLKRAVEGVEAGEFCGIVIAYQSRLGRDVEYEEAVWRRVERAGGRIEMALDGLDTSTVDGKMVRRIRSAMNAAERERHVERFEDLRRWATGAGIWQRRQTPLGYRRDPNTRHLVPDHDADRVRKAFRSRAAGNSLVSIADELGMTGSGARGLLRNRVYLGELRVGEHVNPDAHAPLVTAHEWEEAQLSAPQPARAARPPALLAGLARCQACGHALTRGGDSRHSVYTCHGRSSAGRCPAPGAVTERLLDELVERIAMQQLARLQVTSAPRTNGLESAQDAVREAERELAAYLEGVMAAGLDPADFAAGARLRRERTEAARSQMRRQLAVRPAAPAFGTGADAWRDLDAQERNRVLRGLLEAVIVRRGGGRGSRTPLGARVRVVAAGTGLPIRHKNGGDPMGIVELPFPDLDSPGVLTMASEEHGLKDSSDRTQMRLVPTNT